VNGYRWFDPHQPQTLQIATMLLYLHAVFALLSRYPAGWKLLFLVSAGAGAFGMANAKKWGYLLALVAAFIPFVYSMLTGTLDDRLSRDIIGLMFDVAVVALLVHPMSRNYQKIWYS
jgi:hypothetical protein